MRIHSICKWCKQPHKFSPEAKVSEQMYCTDDCWKDDWIKKGCGLVHPKYPNAVMKFVGLYGSSKTCKKILTRINQDG